MTMSTRSGVSAGSPASYVTVTSAVPGEMLTIAVCGELDTATQHTARASLSSIVASYPPCRVTLDLSRLDFCDCAGARMLADVQRDCGAQGSPCVTRDPQPHVAWLLNWMRHEDPAPP
ncbi:STAS domain-containing protein [Actinoplanes sp. M2I2]|uniref:STAS domain-containing protein n=1 Tax=Actinoplanes sp. M2I2 TaxID=1734444 RepID=UPI002020D836|nr:STAS domain-containing protein [Actinoplanes sp. M2I2]